MVNLSRTAPTKQVELRGFSREELRTLFASQCFLLARRAVTGHPIGFDSFKNLCRVFVRILICEEAA